MSKPSTFKEQYLVKLDYLKEDGYWYCGKEELVYVDVRHGKFEKDNYEEAAELAKALYPSGCTIRSVKYC